MSTLKNVQSLIPLGKPGGPHDWEVAVGTADDGAATAEWRRPDGLFHMIVGGQYGENAVILEEPKLGLPIPGNWKLVDAKGKPLSLTERLVGIVSASHRFSWSNADKAGTTYAVGPDSLVEVTPKGQAAVTSYVAFLLWFNKPRIQGLAIITGGTPPRTVQGGENAGAPIIPVLEATDVLLWALGNGFTPQVADEVLRGDA